MDPKCFLLQLCSIFCAHILVAVLLQFANYVGIYDMKDVYMLKAFQPVKCSRTISLFISLFHASNDTLYFPLSVNKSYSNPLCITFNTFCNDRGKLLNECCSNLIRDRTVFEKWIPEHREIFISFQSKCLIRYLPQKCFCFI